MIPTYLNRLNIPLHANKCFTLETKAYLSKVVVPYKWTSRSWERGMSSSVISFHSCFKGYREISENERDPNRMSILPLERVLLLGWLDLWHVLIRVSLLEDYVRLWMKEHWNISGFRLSSPLVSFTTFVPINVIITIIIGITIHENIQKSLSC